MTPEDTPRMAERTDRQAQIDPWNDVDRLLSAQSDAEIGFMGYVLNTKALDLLNDLHAARSADAALLRERDAQIASLEAEVLRLESRLEQAHVEPSEVHE